MFSFGHDLEAIAFQGGSKLATALDGVFQKIFDYKETQKGKPGYERNVAVFAGKTVLEELPKVIKEHTGAIVTRVIVSKEPDLGFAILPVFGNSTTALVRASNNTDSVDTFDKMIFDMYKLEEDEYTIDDIRELLDALDTKTSRVARPSGDRWKNPKAFSCQVLFDPYIGILPETVLPITTGFSARHLTAIYLHELGHFFSMLELCGHQYRVFSALQAIEWNIAKSKDTKLKREYAAEVVNRVKAGKLALDATTLRELETTLEKADEVEGATETDGRFAAWAILVTTCCARLIGAVIASPFAALYNVLEYGLGEIQTFSPIGKTGDLLRTKENRTLIERYADDFVARHLRAGDQAEALQLLYDMIPSMKMYGHSPDVFRNSKVYRMVSGMFCILSEVMWGDTQGVTGYEHDMRRVKRLHQELIKGLTQHNLPDEYVKEIIANLDAIEKTLDGASKTSRIISFVSEVKYFVEKNLSLGAMISVLTTGKLATEYEALFDRVEKLMANRLYALAAKLKTMQM